MFTDFFNSTIRKNILNEKEQNGNYSFMADVDYRAPRRRYEEFYTKEQLKFLFENGLIQEYTPVGAPWEKSGMKKGDYYEFTNKGIRLREWYTSSLKNYLYYNVFHLYMIRIWWQRFRIACGHRYSWQDYEGITYLDEI